MRTPNSYFLGGALLVAFALASFLYVTFAPDREDTAKGILLFGTTLFPTLMGLALLVVGFASGLFGRTSGDRHEIA